MMAMDVIGILEEVGRSIDFETLLKSFDDAVLAVVLSVNVRATNKWNQSYYHISISN